MHQVRPAIEAPLQKRILRGELCAETTPDSVASSQIVGGVPFSVAGLACSSTATARRSH
ncbi:hypothetical protein IIE18_11575 [Pseudomonas sp. V1]|nr:hypothetical protein [Pseudomonas arcuscaelestis]